MMRILVCIKYYSLMNRRTEVVRDKFFPRAVLLSPFRYTTFSMFLTN